MSAVLCFGETLWDSTPTGRFLGGAPLNVAYHLQRLGTPALLVSAVGIDEAGDAALASIAASGLDTAAVRRHPSAPTGMAVVALDARGEPTFRILPDVAWDEIVEPPENAAATLAGFDQTPAPSAILYGTLALRSESNRRALAVLLSALPHAWATCDLNLRAPYDELSALTPFIARAGLLKLNEREARRLAADAPSDSAPRELAESIHRRYGTAAVCITLGDRGAGLLAGGEWYAAAAPTVTVRDAIGAGDAFTAAFLAGIVSSHEAPPWRPLLERACALGAFVASCGGAQPNYDGHQFALDPADARIHP